MFLVSLLEKKSAVSSKLLCKPVPYVCSPPSSRSLMEARPVGCDSHHTAVKVLDSISVYLRLFPLNNSSRSSPLLCVFAWHLSCSKGCSAALRVGGGAPQRWRGVVMREGKCSKNSSLLPDNGQQIVGLVRAVRSDLVGISGSSCKS